MSKKVPRPRGVDFLINWSMGSWSEDRVLEAINSLEDYVAFRYGVSRAGSFTWEEFAKYYERLKRMYLHGKRPDLLVFSRETYAQLSQKELQLLSSLMDASDAEADPVVEKALFGIEVEVSRWHVGIMIEYQQKRRTTSILGPTFTIKEEDIKPLVRWVKDFKKEVVVIQTFYDRAYAITFSCALKLIYAVNSGQKLIGVMKKRDPKTKKMTYFVSCLKYGKLFGHFDPMPSVEGRVLVDDRGQIWPMISFVDGKLKITDDARKLLDEVATKGILHPDILSKF